MTTVIDSKTLMDEFVQEQVSRHADPDAWRGYRFPVPWFMKQTGGWPREGLCYVYGKAGVGKSSVLMTAVAQIGKDQVRFLYFSLEEGLHACMQRLVSNLEPINRTHFRDICLEQAEWANLYQASGLGGGFQGWWSDSCFTEKEIGYVVQQVNPDVVFVDYLQLMTMPGKSMTDQVAAGSKFLKRLSKGQYTNKRPITVISAVQANEQDNSLGSRDPERDGDLICEIRKIEDGNGGYIQGKREFRIRKMRNGTGDIQTDLAFFGGRSLIGELTTAPNVGKMKVP
jgi:replicative DNA helicase